MRYKLGWASRFGVALLMGILTFSLVVTTAPTQIQGAIAQATAAARQQQREQQVRQVRPETYDLSRYPVTDANERHWRNVLWTTGVVEPQEPYVAEAIAQIVSLTARSGLSRPQQRTVEMAMQIATQLYFSNPTGYAAIGQQFLQTVERSPNPEWSAMALSALVKTGLDPQQRQRLGDRLRQRFPQWNQDIYLFTTLRDLALLQQTPTTPPLGDLLKWTIAPNQVHLYVICRPDRGVLCQTVVKDGNGQFLRENGQLWSIPLLLRSLHELSWNFTRGQTPQGIYRIEGVRPANMETFRAYGAYDLVKLFAPYEEGVREFVPGRPGQLPATLTAYQALLPPSWRNYFPIQQSYWAGKAGRGLFRIHGSGEDPGFFTNNNRYPKSLGWNPAIGCLSALELYDDTGRLQQADMPPILNALTRLGGRSFTGYLTVVEVPGADTPVSIAEIEAAINS
ncbi:hypothetical protein H6G89_25015 [Oscillatoria sp. FACHB-1407]|uniref:hypothetical protein n=1 Tax=Oscillatoria sp. FACHB-1407 TaxID=2692847 RepID=UPI0016843BE2|nr:hypothetical protein [Oscillatoria sp. FACHB-1407]MBD2464270.1 hypothetical protein [Oscillatoria sp. FACHB-1407]